MLTEAAKACTDFQKAEVYIFTLQKTAHQFSIPCPGQL